MNACRRRRDWQSLRKRLPKFIHEGRSFQARNFTSVTPYPQLTKGISTSCTWKCVCEAWSIFDTVCARRWLSERVVREETVALMANRVSATTSPVTHHQICLSALHFSCPVQTTGIAGDRRRWSQTSLDPRPWSPPDLRPSGFPTVGSQIADKHQMAYSQAMGWLRCRLSFALLRSSILCLRGARARVKQNFLLQPAVALAEGGMCWHFWLRTDQDQPSKYFFLHTDMHSPLDSIPHTLGVCTHPYTGACAHVILHICTHTRSHAPSIPQRTFCCFLCLSLPAVISMCFLLCVIKVWSRRSGGDEGLGSRLKSDRLVGDRRSGRGPRSSTMFWTSARTLTDWIAWWMHNHRRTSPETVFFCELITFSDEKGFINKKQNT